MINSLLEYNFVNVYCLDTKKYYVEALEFNSFNHDNYKKDNYKKSKDINRYGKKRRHYSDYC